ncbi:MAG: PQQ-binding-like beta-propeller repeat protein, partial [Acidimicrobiales bacterium]|nr:PQQ-binding-like beta-propeller repeat protein [Acidimicrobiales bacterium]
IEPSPISELDVLALGGGARDHLLPAEIDGLVVHEVLDVVEARDPDTLELRWQHALPGGSLLWRVEHAGGPTVLVYASSSGLISGLSGADGSILWQRDDLVIHGHPGNARIYVSTAGSATVTLGELNAVTGELGWTATLGSHDPENAFVSIGEGELGTVVELTGGSDNAKELVLVDPESGSIRWRMTTEADSFLAVDTRFGVLQGAEAVSGIDLSTGETLWRHEGVALLEPRNGQVTLNGARVIDLATGKLVSP